MDVENSLESHKPVEIGDLRPWCACRGAGYTESPTRRGGAADGPLRGRGKSLEALDWTGS